MKRKRPWNLHRANRFACYRRTEISHDRALRPLNYNEGHTKHRPVNATPPIFANLSANGTTVKSLHRVVISIVSTTLATCLSATTIYFLPRQKEETYESVSAFRDEIRHDTTRHDVLYLNLRLFDPFFKRNENRMNLSIAAYPVFHGNLIVFLLFSY